MFNANILRPVKFNDSTFDSGKILFVLILYIRKVLGISYWMNSTFEVFM